MRLVQPCISACTYPSEPLCPCLPAVSPTQCDVSKETEKALRPLVATYPTVHFVKVHYEDIEFDNAGVPAILAYKNQGDLLANLTGVYSMIAEDEDFDTESLRRLFKKLGIL